MPIPNLPIIPPSNYVGVEAIAFADANGLSHVPSAAEPLPVSRTYPPAASTPLAGTSGGATVAGPFTPERGRPVALKLSGTWTGKVTVRSSMDGGTTKLPLTVGGRPWGVFTANANEAGVVCPTIAGETFYLDIAVTTGTLTFWMGQ